MTPFQKGQIENLTAPRFEGDTRRILKEPMRTPILGVEDFDPTETVAVLNVVARRKWANNRKWLEWEIQE